MSTEVKNIDYVICEICGYSRKIIPGSWLRSKSCLMCTESIGESNIKKYLTKHDICFETQKSFEKCRNVNKLPFDFYLPKQNILIEYDGEQHLREGAFGRDKNVLKLIQKRDNIKTKFCIDNDIKLIRIPYNKKKKISEILDYSL